MAETGEETYYIVGESRTNVDNAITKVYGSFFIAFEVIPSTGVDHTDRLFENAGADK